MKRLDADGRVAATIRVQFGTADGGLRAGRVAGHEDGLVARDSFSMDPGLMGGG